jgi:DNA-binding MarR family transcriptional regulator
MEEIKKWVNQPRTKKILVSFAVPATPSQVELSLGLKKLKLAPFLQKGIIRPLNPSAKKGRLYILTDKARQLLYLAENNIETKADWKIIGWIMASPRQRLSVLKTVARDPIKRTSEAIRRRSANLNPNLTRISTKETLKELISKNLIATEKGDDRRRYYWITPKGKSVISTIDLNSPESSLLNHSSQ